MTYRLSPPASKSWPSGRSWRTTAHDGRSSTPATKWSHGAGTSADYTLCSASRRTDVRLVNVAEEIDRLIER
jgi:hypothetical protein